MAVSVYGSGELLQFSAKTRQDLFRIFLSMEYRSALTMIRDMRVALANYAKHNRFDDIQLAVLGNLELVSGWCRDAYFSKAMKDLKNQFPNLKKESLKCKVREKWEKVMLGYRY